MTLLTYDIQGQRRDASGNLHKFGFVLTCEETAYLHRGDAQKIAEAIYHQSANVEVTHTAILDSTERTPWPVEPSPPSNPSRETPP